MPTITTKIQTGAAKWYSFYTEDGFEDRIPDGYIDGISQGGYVDLYAGVENDDDWVGCGINTITLGFANVAFGSIPAGSTITSAYVRFKYLYDNYLTPGQTGLDIAIRALNISGPGSSLSGGTDPAAVSPWTDPVTWTSIPDLEFEDDIADTPDISAIIQTLLDNGYLGAGTLLLWIEPNISDPGYPTPWIDTVLERQFKAVADDTPELIITYEEPPQTEVDRALSWDVAAGVNIDRAVSWDVQAGVQTDRTLSWAVHTPVAVNRSLAWSVQQQINVDRALSWSVIGQVAADRALSWDVLQAVQADRALSWAVLSTLTTDRQLAWSVRQAIEADRSPSWAVRQQINADRELLWTTIGKVLVDRAPSWDIRATIEADRAPSWDIRAIVSADRAVSWDVRTLTAADSVLLWDVRALVDVDRDLAWDIREIVEADRELVWRVRTNAIIRQITVHGSARVPQAVSGAPHTLAASGSLHVMPAVSGSLREGISATGSARQPVNVKGSPA